ncbi:MAG: formyltransferase family protein [bacterium]|nr:formyltransferase family protein [bacterium]
MDRPKIIVFASGTKDAGGSGFENLVAASKSGVLDAEVVAVVSNQEHGGVRERADRLGVPFIYFNSVQHTNILENVGMLYQEVVRKSGAEWAALSGWLKMTKGLNPQKTFNIHPALLSQLGGRFGGSGMYGHHVHEAVKKALDAGEITESGFTMHFVTDEFDRGPAFFEFRVPLQKGMSADEIAKAVNEVEHEWQPRITNMVVHEEISWDGKNPESLVVPEGYQYLPHR